MSEDLDFDLDNLDQKISKYFSSEEIQSLVLDANKKNLSREISRDNNMLNSLEDCNPKKKIQQNVFEKIWT